MFRPALETIDAKYLQMALEGQRAKLLAELESKTARRLGVPHVIAVANGALAIHLSLCAIDMKRGDKMITSINAHPSLGQAIRQFDAEPIFCDIDPQSYNMSLTVAEDVLAAGAKKLRGALFSFAAGQSANLDKMYEIRNERKSVIIVEAFGAFGMNALLEEGKPDMFVTSLFPIESLFGANVGFIATHNDVFKERAEMIRNNGLDRRSTNVSYTYDMLDLGYAYMPSALDLAYALSALDISDRSLARRLEIASRYDHAFASLSHITPPIKNAEHAYTNYIIKIDKNRDNFARALLADGIEVALHYIPLHLMSYYRSKYAIKITEFPRALSNYQHILSIPISASLSDNDVAQIIGSVLEHDQSRAW
jgi:dTDP-4-amino-4,6-dideoxygalactose transaminase